ncbi:hypothetical protein BGZ65_003391 [Modicella reniformis]|uniref:Uncharacterized protein n=1 Tax=Modicella reniformis TaxID=1440133 RepID=A0A9P6STN2_9FUNG|nr:hypothetical protein BGZ65_003391 [Modicella reniformis]
MEVHYETMVSIVDKCQDELTAVMDELSVLTLKATMAYATAVSNLWGSIYKKLLEYTIRILLRLHLAPQREGARMERSNRTIQEAGKTSPEEAPMTRKRWLSRMKDLCDELSDSLRGKHNGGNGRRAAYRMEAITRTLYHLQTNEPAPRNFRILPLDEHIVPVTDDEDTAASDTRDSAEAHVSNETFDLGDCGDDLDDYDDYEDDDDVALDAESNVTAEKDSTSKRLRALQAVTKMLIESPSIHQEVTPSYVGAHAFKETSFTPKEYEVVVMIVNSLGLFVPKRQPKSDESGTQESIPHVALRSPLAFIANTILRATGYQNFTRRVAPGIATGSEHGMAMGATGIYKVFCSKAAGHFDINDFTGAPLTNVTKAVSPPENKNAVFGSFFDMDLIDRICRAHGSRFTSGKSTPWMFRTALFNVCMVNSYDPPSTHNRITYVDRFTISLTGNVITHKSPGAPRHPVKYVYDEKRKKKKPPDQQFIKDSALSRSEVQKGAEEAAEAIEQLTEVVTPLRKDLKVKLTVQSAASLRVKSKE